MSRKRFALHLAKEDANSKDEEEDDDTKPSDASKRRTPPFPPSSYPLLEDEEAIRHSWISFIDYPPWEDLYSQVTRLVEPRRYARRRQFKSDNKNKNLPTAEDVALPRSPYSAFATALAWNGLPARGIVFALAYLAFPFVISFLDMGWNDVNDNITGDDLVTLLNVFLPGISIVLGTLISVTISILYERIGRLQGVVSEETALLSLLAQRLMETFHQDNDNNNGETDATTLIQHDLAQCIADQVRTLVFESRGREIMALVYTDPYARILTLLAQKEREGCKDSVLQSSFSEIRSIVKELRVFRARRMSDEALALPSTHFDVLTFLCAILLGGYCLGTVAVIHDKPEIDPSSPPLMAQVLFAIIVAVYVLIYEFAFDLNRPYYGTYQLRRSSAAMHLLEIKLLFQKLNVEVDFETIPVEEEKDEEEPVGSGDSTDRYRRRKKQIWYY